MKDKTIISGCTIAATLLAYYYAKGVQKDVVPYMMIAGFAGAVVGELIVETWKKKPTKDGNTNHQ